jgi:hypothetical protein
MIGGNNNNCKLILHIITFCVAVCDDIIAFKYSEESTLAWLAQKVDKTAKLLFRKGISSNEASVSANFSKTSVDNNDSTLKGDKMYDELIIRYDIT